MRVELPRFTGGLPVLRLELAGRIHLTSDILQFIYRGKYVHMYKCIFTTEIFTKQQDETRTHVELHSCTMNY